LRLLIPGLQLVASDIRHGLHRTLVPVLTDFVVVRLLRRRTDPPRTKELPATTVEVLHQPERTCQLVLFFQGAITSDAQDGIRFLRALKVDFNRRVEDLTIDAPEPLGPRARKLRNGRTHRIAAQAVAPFPVAVKPSPALLDIGRSRAGLVLI